CPGSSHGFCFSSRRRHTRSKRDWSSDVCSSDLEPTFVKLMTERVKEAITWLPKDVQINSALLFSVHSQPGTEEHNASFIKQYERSEERRVGKERTAREATTAVKKKDRRRTRHRE